MDDINLEQISALKPGRYVIFEGIPCTIVSMQTSKSGKHGHAKCRVEAIGIKDGRKIIKVMPSSDKVEVPIIEKKNAQVLSISGNMANVMDIETYETFDIPIPDEFKDDIKEGSNVCYWVVMGEKLIKPR